MKSPRHLVISVQYDRYPNHGRSLAWIAPELREAGLEMTDDHLDEPSPTRAWAGLVDGPTFERFAHAWGLDEAEHAPRTYVFDGMNWEAAGESPIVYVVVRVCKCTGNDAVGAIDEAPARLSQALCGRVRARRTPVH
jgi:hypothetical protein